MSAFESTTQDSTAELTDFDGRPDGCSCLPSFEGLSCWPCARDGFDVPNPNTGEE